MRVVVVEDEGALRAYVAAVAGTSGWQVTAVESMSAGWEAFKAMRPDVVLIDQTLPDGDGTRLGERVRDSGTRVVMMSGGLPEGSGMEFLAKPFSMDELKRTLEG
jgi:DNA-binding response OmpR family regulator